jgi:hypothetical protein
MRTTQNSYSGTQATTDNRGKMSNNPLKITLGIIQGCPLLTTLPTFYTDNVIWKWEKEITFCVGNILVNTSFFADVQATLATSEDCLQSIHKFSTVGTK